MVQPSAAREQATAGTAIQRSAIPGLRGMLCPNLRTGQAWLDLSRILMPQCDVAQHTHTVSRQSAALEMDAGGCGDDYAARNDRQVTRRCQGTEWIRTSDNIYDVSGAGKGTSLPKS